MEGGSFLLRAAEVLIYENTCDKPPTHTATFTWRCTLGLNCGLLKTQQSAQYGAPTLQEGGGGP